jgi:hypothetical protein
MKPGRERLQLFAGGGIYQLGRGERDMGVVEVVPASHLIELAPNPCAQRVGRNLGQHSPGPAP